MSDSAFDGIRTILVPMR